MLIYNAQEDRYKVMADVRRGEHALKALGYAGWQRGALLATWAPLSKPLSKGERRQSPFRAAAFLGANGTVYETGPFHDVEALPAGVEVSAEGFVDVDGRFHSREQASQELQADHPVQSEELELKKGEDEDRVNNKSTLVKNNRGYMTDLSDYLQEQGNNSGKKIDRDNIQARLKDHQETLEAMASQQGQHPAFQVASKMAGHPADAELRRAAELLHGDDVLSVALAAHGLNPKDEGLRMAVEAACQQLRLGKTEMNVAVLPRAVESGQQGADHMAMVIRQAFAHNLVYEVRLGGKHSAGTAIAYDQEGDRFWLLKPGSARVSPALGVSQTGYNQSRREVAFNQACRAYEPMREYYPDCWLLLLDGQEVACMEVMGPGYRPAQKYGDAAELLEPYQDNLDLYRWAWWDYVLGNPDSHGGNILVTEDGRVALIDHGSSLAGPAFNPAADPRKSFIPYYLRVSSPDFAELNAEQRYHAFPHPTPDERETLKAWMRGLGDAWIQRLQELCPEATPACVRRADELLKEDDPADALLRSWAGVPAAESK